MTTPLLTVAEVAAKLRQSKRFVYDELKRKNLVGSHFGGAWHITEADLERYVEAHLNVSRVKGRAS